MSLTSEKKINLYASLQASVYKLIDEFDQIPEERKQVLNKLALFVTRKLTHSEKAELNFICTHNSRRSHLAQIWAQTAAAYYGLDDVVCYSGGTEATAFNPRAVRAMEEAGFVIQKTSAGTNPVYEVHFADDASPVIAFSKKYDAEGNPTKGFGAVMTCSHADQNCPLVMGAAERFPITYDDPKDFDDTPLEASKYSERVHQIGREILYAFSLVHN